MVILEKLEFIMSKLGHMHEAYDTCVEIVECLRTSRKKASQGEDLQAVMQLALNTFGIGLDTFDQLDFRDKELSELDKVMFLSSYLTGIIDEMPEYKLSSAFNLVNTQLDNIVAKNVVPSAYLVFALRLINSYVLKMETREDVRSVVSQ